MVKYSKELAADICGQIAEGKSLRTICASKDMPVMSAIFTWLSKYEDFEEQYTRAKQEQAEAFVEDMNYIAETEEDVQRAKLKIDTRKWIASRLKPKKYGERTTLDHQGRVELSVAEAARLYDAEAKNRPTETDR